MVEDKGLTYSDAGVDIAAGDDLVRRIAPAARATARAGVVGGIGGFGGLFDLRAAGYSDPLLVAATDGVGTKLRVGIESGLLGGLGQDLVAMCVNDLVCQGAEPLFFLDYYATGRLEVDSAAQVIEGIARACAACGCALIGGETAEMPGIYAGNDFDLAGFAVGAVERDRVLPAGVEAGDVLLGLPSDGLHSNGFSLVRRIAADRALAWSDPAPFAEGTTAEALLASTRLYVDAVRRAISVGGVHAAAHITGGGLTENIPRVLPDDAGAEIDLGSWTRAPVFDWLADQGGVASSEMLRTFNCGIGMVLAAAPSSASDIMADVRRNGEEIFEIGRIISGRGVSYIGEW